MKVHLEINYEVEADDPEAEEIGMQLIADETQSFAVSLRGRFADAGLDIHEFRTKVS